MIICSDIDLVVYGKWDSLFLFTLEKVLRERGYVDLVFVKVFDKVFVSILEKLLNKEKLNMELCILILFKNIIY